MSTEDSEQTPQLDEDEQPSESEDKKPTIKDIAEKETQKESSEIVKLKSEESEEHKPSTSKEEPTEDDQEDEHEVEMKDEAKNEPRDENLNGDDHKMEVEEADEKEENPDIKENLRSQSRQSLAEVQELYKEPAFAEICSFFNIFGALLGIKSMPFTKLESLFVSSGEDNVNKELIDIQVMLMRRIRPTIHVKPERYEHFLLKFCNHIPQLDEEALQLERFGYEQLSISYKLNIFKTLCEAQFDYNLKFKENIFNTYYINEMRLAPIGTDKNGQPYWYQQDCDLNIRIYTEEPDDKSGGTWTLIVKNDAELSELIENLKNPNFGQKQESESEDEEAILDKPKTSPKKTKENSKAKNEEPIDYKALLKPEIMEKYIKTLERKMALSCGYQDGTNLNKKKQEKEKKKNEKLASTQVPAHPSENGDNKKDDSENETEKPANGDVEEFEIPPEDERRILPRRSARNQAMDNIKSFVSPAKKKEHEKKVSNAKTPPPLSASEASDSSEIEEESEDESEETLDSSDKEYRDHNFIGSKRRRGRKKKDAKQKTPKTPRPKTGLVKPKKKKSEMIAFEESSDEEEEAEEVKIRKKAEKGTFCMQCDKSTRPDILLLCDMCDEAWHTHCLKPMLHYVPDGDWFCPRCHHAMLIERLSTLLADLKEKLETKKVDDKKKKAAAERLKREMEYIGISLSNVIPSKTDPKSKKKVEVESEPSSEESDEGEEGMRKSKKKALKKVMGRRRKEEYYGPVVTIAEGRSRRSNAAKVDFTFSKFDEMIKDAIDTDDEPDPHDIRPQGGLGRGKDINNIIEAERQRRGSDDAGAENTAPSTGRPPAARKPAILRKKKPKLTDLNVDNATESDSEEYKGTSAEEEEEPEPSEDEYMPSDLEVRRGTRSSRRGGRTRSDDEFINDSDSDYAPSSKKKRGKKQATRRSARKGRGKRGRYDDYSSEEETDQSDFSAKSSEDDRKRKRKNAKKRKNESDEESDHDYTETGRPLRRASKKAIEKFHEELKDEEEDEEEEEDQKSKKDKRPVGALTRISKKKDEEDEFKPDDEEEDGEDEEDEEAPEEEQEDEEDEENSEDESKKKSTKPKSGRVIGMPPTRRPTGAGVGRRISSSSEEDEEEEEDIEEKNDQEKESDDDELPSMVMNKNSRKEKTPEKRPEVTKDSKTSKEAVKSPEKKPEEDRPSSPTLEDFLPKQKTKIVLVQSSAKSSQSKNAMTPSPKVTQNSTLTTTSATAPSSNVPIENPPLPTIKKTVIAPLMESALPSWDSLAAGSPRVVDSNREVVSTASTSAPIQAAPQPPYSGATYTSMQPMQPVQPAYQPHHPPPPPHMMMSHPGYAMPPPGPHPYFPPAPGYHPYPPPPEWVHPRPNFIPLVPISGGPLPISQATNPEAPPPTSDPESLGQALAGAMNTDL